MKDNLESFHNQKKGEMMAGKKRGISAGLIVMGIICFIIATFVMMTNAGATAPPPNPNQVEYWCPNGGVKYEEPGTPFTVPEPPAGFVWTLLVLKAGSEQSADPVNEQFPNPVVGDEYSRTDGKDISHAILCQGVAPTTTTGATTTAATTTIATTTTHVTYPTTTQPTTTTTGATTTLGTTTTGATTTIATTTTEDNEETTTTGATTTAATTTTGATTTLATTTTGATTTVVNTTQETAPPTTAATTTAPTTTAATTTVHQPAPAAPAPVVTEAPTTTVPTELPRTGFPVVPVTALGVIMIAIGAVMRKFA